MFLVFSVIEKFTVAAFIDIIDECQFGNNGGPARLIS
jgi:hypothetical protein